MKILILGYGSIGKKHHENLTKYILPDIEKDAIISIHDPEKQMFANMEDIYDLVLICTPTKRHLEDINYFMNRLYQERPSVLFVEKPLYLDPVWAFYKPVPKPPVIDMQIVVGYNYKFERGLRKLRECLYMVGDIRYATLENGYAFEKMHNYNKNSYDGIIYDDIHIINIAKWLFGKPEQYLFSYVSRDLSIGLWKTAKAQFVHFSTDCLNQRYKKRIEVRGNEGNLVWNMDEHELFFCSKDESTRKSIPYQNIDMFIEEMRYIIHCVRDNEAMAENRMEEAIEDLEVIECLKKLSS